jgi:hypothetical protein
MKSLCRWFAGNRAGVLPLKMTYKGCNWMVFYDKPETTAATCSPYETNKKGPKWAFFVN